MPICPRCGKSLSSEQALAYHLNRKYKCGIWKCGKCAVVFDTKFALNIHENKCITDKLFSYPSFDKLCEIYSNPFLLYIEIDTTGIIHSISPSCKTLLGFSQNELIGTIDNSIINSSSSRKTKNNDIIDIKRFKLNDNLFIELPI